MNKIILSSIFFLFICSNTVHAQRISFGIKAGTDIKKLSGKSFNDQFSYGYHAGVFTDLRITSRFRIQPEIYFSQVNIDTSSSFSSIYSFQKISKVQLKYIAIPILLSYKPNRFVALQAGPQFGILMDNANTVLQNGKDAFKKGDFGLLAGIQLSVSKLRIYGRYGVGLNNLNDIDNREKWKSQTIQLGLGFAF